MTIQTDRTKTSGVDILTTTLTVTPTQAMRWLNRNPLNRKLRRSRIEKYAQEMAAGQWALNGEAIKFDREGNLIDGQHRLHACIESATEFTTVVVTNLPVEAQLTMDTGGARTPADMLGLTGVHHAALAAAGAKGVIIWDRYRWVGNALNHKATHPDIREFITANPDYLDLMASAQTGRKKVDLTASEIAATWFILSRIDRGDAALFFDYLLSGVGLHSGSPILALRDRLRTIKMNRTRLPQAARYSLVFRAWNAWRDGRQLSTLPVTQNAAPVEPR